MYVPLSFCFEHVASCPQQRDGRCVSMQEDTAGWVQLLQVLGQLGWENLDERITNSRALAAAALNRGDALCTSTSLSFTVPPIMAHGVLADGSSFHIRMRTGVSSAVIGTKFEWEEWENPLKWNGGYNFEPRYNPARTDKKGVPPPVVLDPLWEQKFIVNSPMPQVCFPFDELIMQTITRDCVASVLVTCVFTQSLGSFRHVTLYLPSLLDLG